MLKCFKVLSSKFRHTAYTPLNEDDGETIDEARHRSKVCFGAVAVICQYQLENGQPLYHIFVGDM